MKSIARIYVWWPSLSTDIENFVNSCDQCQMNASSLSSEAVQPWPAADVWQRVHLDYASINGRQLLILFDAGSKWLEAKFMQSTTSNATLRTLYEWFSRYGFPVQVHTDGGPQFTSNEFTEKMKDWGIKLSVSPPYRPSCNGSAERAVRIVKESLRKSVPLEQILFAYRATPVVDKSPAELMFGRKLRTRLSALKPNDSPENPSGSKFSIGNRVWVRDFRSRRPKWQRGVCTGLKGRSIVIVTVDDDNTLRRHINDVRSDQST
ncbi:Uncharacterised protein r2_g2494 [Pycnogonum litorale]